MCCSPHLPSPVHRCAAVRKQFHPSCVALIRLFLRCARASFGNTPGVRCSLMGAVYAHCYTDARARRSLAQFNEIY